MTSLAFAILGSAMLPKLQLIVFLLLVSLLLVGYISIRISSMFYLPTVFCMGIMPMLLLGLTWTESRLPIALFLVALLALACFSRRTRHAMHVLALLFTGLLPLLLLLVVEDVFWSAGFLLAYLGVQGCHTNDANDRPVALADDGHGHMTVDRARYCLLCA